MNPGRPNRLELTEPRLRNRQLIKGLYAITPDEADTHELLRKTRLALQAGVRLLQYRNKTANSDLRSTQALALRKLTHEYSTTFIINDDVHLAEKIDADGVHIGANDCDLLSARALLGNEKIIGISCYNRLSLAQEAVSAGADYVAFGAFSPSSIKPGAVKADIGLLSLARAELDVPLVAIGGITAQNGSALLEAGASALAVISAVFGSANIKKSAQEFSNLFDKV